MLQKVIWHFESSRCTKTPHPRRVTWGLPTAPWSRRCPVPCCRPPARGTASAASTQPYRPIDLQLIFHAVLQGPWDKILSLLFIRNHDCPCCIGEARKVHKEGGFQDAESIRAWLCWGRELCLNWKFTCLNFTCFSMFMEYLVSAVEAVISSFFPVEKELSLLLKICRICIFRGCARLVRCSAK